MSHYESKSDAEILDMLSSFCEFSDDRGYIITSMARPKENEEISHGGIPMFREIFTDEKSLRRKYAKIKTLGQNYISEEGNTLTFRIYFTPNARDTMSAFYSFDKKITEFQENIYNGHKETKKKIRRMDKIWKSTIEKDKNKAESYFIIDIDTTNTDIFEKGKGEIQELTDIIHTRKSPNGYHILTEPFNPNKFDKTDLSEFGEVKKDSLMFIGYC